MAASTTRTQRIGIWIITIFMTVGTVGVLAAAVLSSQNAQKDQAHLKQLMSQYQADQDAQAKQLSDQYYPTFSQYTSRPAVFDASSVTALQTEDLVVGTGDPITTTSSFTAYYIGWTPDGKVFDSSLSGDALKAPYNVVPGRVIEGWTQGVNGMKVGGIRELTIPSDEAYGSTGSGSSIPPNTPLKFIIMIIPTPKAVEMPQELLNYYQTQSGGGQ